MPKKSTSRLKVTTDDVVLREDSEPDDLHSVGIEESALNGKRNGFSSFDALHASLVGNVQRVLAVDEDACILQKLRDKKLSLKKALRLLMLLENVASLTDKQMDGMTRIAGFPVSSRALAAYIREIGEDQLVGKARVAISNVMDRDEKRALLAIELDSQDHEVFAGTIAEPN